MYRATLRTASRQTLGRLRPQASRSAPRRFASTSTSTSTSPADRPRSWKSLALRCGLAIGAVSYYYSTNSVFAEETEQGTSQSARPPARRVTNKFFKQTSSQLTSAQRQKAPRPISAPLTFAESDLPTVESVVEKKRQQLRGESEEQPPRSSQVQSTKSTTPEIQPSTDAQTTAASASPEAPLELEEEEGGQEGAFNPETGEINWDCPCLGGMAHGPCGEDFKTAFSCFVFSNAEPKGMDCIDKFQGMQECFRRYPDIYGAELTDDEGGEDGAPEGDGASREEDASNSSSKIDPLETQESKSARPVADNGVPKQWEDATDADRKDAQEEQPGKLESKE
ncbi:hypothetical protein C2857_005001 [Epichloe festucae Fl1]|uniref:Mitochondrial intermembrane space import and assembly protein 40 n=1 Tax=Epichloe festucae (strain Fl1) TaxID=877507 RepID=A0A7S9KPB1_EPIFF|nr:hypothetical protein C2857_005001 [Epichloe festucae Fl1]